LYAASQKSLVQGSRPCHSSFPNIQWFWGSAAM
jgi:hypothetical protein